MSPSYRHRFVIFGIIVSALTLLANSFLFLLLLRKRKAISANADRIELISRILGEIGMYVMTLAP